MRLTLPLVLLLSFAAHAGDDLTPEKRAQIQRDQEKANAEVEKKYGNKKSSELSQDERRQQIKDKAEAEKAVLDKHGVDQKDFARSGAKMSREDRAATEAAGKALEKKEADAAKAGAKGGQKEIVVEHGDPERNEAAEADQAAGYGRGPQKKKK